MKILLIGSGGREHALAWKIRQSPLVARLFCAPGNPGIGQIATLVPLKSGDLKGLASFAAENHISLAVVGPEVPLAEGIVDLFRENGLKIFGPTKAAAELEGSKVFAKHFMQRHQIPTAEFRTFTAAERYDAERYINEIPAPIVIKADGLAAGKGVTVCESKEKALEILTLMMDGGTFGEAASRVVIEECLIGDEVSVFAITDGENFTTLPPAQDHKRILDNDLGKNTGGMGAVAPAAIVTDDLMERIRKTIIRPTLAGMAAEGRSYTGCLYAGLMITETGPKVIEFNCRFGDPETQAILPLLEDDLVTLLLESSSGSVKTSHTRMRQECAACVVIASGGYPDDFETGKSILGLQEAESENVIVFHAGTREQHGAVVTAGGRVLGVTATAPAGNLEGAIDSAYRAVEKIAFDGMYYRSDIGRKSAERLRQLQEGEQR